MALNYNSTVSNIAAVYEFETKSEIRLVECGGSVSSETKTRTQLIQLIQSTY